jgi:hemerythrin superfamily protein
MTTHNDTDDLVTELVKDHDEVREIFRQLRPGGAPTEELMDDAAGAVVGPDPETTPTTPTMSTDQDHLVRRMTVELVKHSVAEEVHLYPLIRQVLPDGDQLADHEIEEHAEVEQLLKDLEGLDPSDTDYQRKLDKVIEDVSHHAEEEESTVFPQLRDQCTEEQLRELGDKVRRTKAIAPTRPHPSAPDTPPGNLLAGPLAGMVDRVRDAFSRG